VIFSYGAILQPVEVDGFEIVTDAQSPDFKVTSCMNPWFQNRTHHYVLKMKAKIGS
jgi:hypothetical protein